jgi:transposase
LAAAPEPSATTSQSGLGERVVRTVEARLSRRAAARRFEVGVSFVTKLVQRWPR